jgi:hypothetical protein
LAGRYLAGVQLLAAGFPTERKRQSEMGKKERMREREIEIERKKEKER